MLVLVAAALCFVLQTVAGQTGYIECIPGSLNVILAAPHGGDLTPASIPDRTAGCWNALTKTCTWTHTCGTPDYINCDATTVTDSYTIELTRAIRTELFQLTGLYPTIVINNLDRVKLDANRDIGEAAFGVAAAEAAWYEFHQCIDTGKAAMGQEKGLFFDIHGHGHETVWAELGYLISASKLNSGDPIDPATTSIRHLASVANTDFENLLRGADSFGAYLEEEGYAAVPSPTNPGPGAKAYFSGGYNTDRHGSKNNGLIDAIQIESARAPREEIPSYAPAIASAIVRYMTQYSIPTQA